MQHNPANFSRTLLAAAAVAIALGQAGCGSKEPEPTLPPVAKPAPPPKVETRTLHELAAEYGVSAERIRQIEAKAMQKMRGMLAALA